MIHEQDKRAMMKGWVSRVIVLFLLLYTGADIAFPQICNEELKSVTAQTQSSSREASGLPEQNVLKTASLVATESQGEQPSPDPNQDEDCFCCCAHILPGTIVSGPHLLELRTQSSPPEQRLLPSRPRERAFHPPRFA